jgi:hypothetical protein
LKILIYAPGKFSRATALAMIPGKRLKNRDQNSCQSKYPLFLTAKISPWVPVLEKKHRGQHA